MKTITLEYAKEKIKTLKAYVAECKKEEEESDEWWNNLSEEEKEEKENDDDFCGEPLELEEVRVNLSAAEGRLEEAIRIYADILEISESELE